MKTKNKIQKLYQKVAVFIIAMLATLLVNNVARAAYGQWNGDENGGMVQKGVYSDTGLLPQIWKDKEFVGKADTEYPYEEWRIDLTPGTVYCDDYGALIRFGAVDPKTYYTSSGSTISAFHSLMREEWNLKADRELEKIEHRGETKSFGSSNYNRFYRRIGKNVFTCI